MDTLTAIHETFKLITENTLVLTPNRRLSAYLLTEYDSANKETKAWATPQIMDLTSWLKSIYTHHMLSTHSPQLISDTAESHLWQQMISVQNDLFISQPSHIALKIKQAWDFLHLWKIPITDLACYHQKDYQWFLSLVYLFQEKLLKDNLITTAQLFDIILNEKTTLAELPVNRIILFGFDELNPSTKQLFDYLQTHKTLVSFSLDKKAKSIKAYAFDNIEHEIKNMAHWAKHQFEHGKKNIACIVPNLLEHRQTIQHIFFETFYPQHYFNQQKPQSVFSITGGEPLAETPIIQTLIHLLKTINPLFNFETLAYLLHSPFIKGGISEQYQRALFASHFREEAFLHIKLRQVISALNKANTCPMILEIFNMLRAFPYKSTFTINQWITKVSSLLSQVGWPGERILSSIEYQQVNKFTETLHELSSLNAYNSPISFQHFLNLLIEQLKTQLFQAKNATAPVEVLGVLEAAGQEFDAIWLMDLTNETWPENPRPNPFIPAEIARQYHLPHANAEKELDFSQKMQNRFIHSTQEIIFSWAEINEGNPVSPSQLIEQYISMDKIDTFVEATPNRKSTVTLKQSLLQEHIPISESLFQTDSSVIKKQAECPFQAFAHYRLKAKPVEKINFLTSKKTRGILLHYVLQNFWQKYQNLQNIIDTPLANLTLPHAKEHVSYFYKQQNIDNPDFIELEINRINQLLIRWLSLELERDDFSIYEIEKSHNLFIDKLKLRLRVDRVDRLHDGKLIIIDYKSGIVSEKKWVEDEFLEPQLPIYCLLFPEQIVGLVFASVNPENMRFKGITTASCPLPGKDKQKDFTTEINAFIQSTLNTNTGIKNSKTMTFSEMFTLQQAWQLKIKQIAHSFIAGDNTINPVNDQVCLFCQRQSLCRINETKRTTIT